MLNGFSQQENDVDQFHAYLEQEKHQILNEVNQDDLICSIVFDIVVDQKKGIDIVLINGDNLCQSYIDKNFLRNSLLKFNLKYPPKNYRYKISYNGISNDYNLFINRLNDEKD